MICLENHGENMSKKLADILKEKKLVFLQTERQTLDTTVFEMYQDKDERFEESKIFESEGNGKIRKCDTFHSSIFTYFLDGSRKTYKIGDIITTDKKFVPIVAGQIGAACCHRNDDRKLNKYQSTIKNILTLYDGINDHDFDMIKEAFEFQNPHGVNIEVHKYNYDSYKDDSPTNAAIAKIHKMMADEEIRMITSMVEQGVLNTDQMMVIDGSLQFLTQKFNPEIFYNVIGISKSYNPNLTGVLKGRRHIGVLLSQLKYGERTPVYKYETKKNNIIGAWYLRIRPKEQVRNPLEGVVKVEKMAIGDDIMEDGFETCIIDNISSSILAERIPTCHGIDKRWANHLYPIYLTEAYLKSSFMSDKHFINLF